MNIVLEGPDGSGKSTLASKMGQLFQRKIQASEGPPHYTGELNDRIRRYHNYQDIIFDRHPVISQTIYAQIRANNEERVDPYLETDFYMSKPLIIYCRATSLNNHVLKPEYDTPEHVAKLTDNYHVLVREYDAWALRHASIIYRLGHDIMPLLHYVYAAIGSPRNLSFNDH